MSWLDAELIALIGTCIVGFATMSYQLGRYSRGVSELKRQVVDVTRALTNHEVECAGREKEISKALSDGARKMATLDERTKHILEDIREIKGAMRGE